MQLQWQTKPTSNYFSHKINHFEWNSIDCSDDRSRFSRQRPLAFEKKTFNIRNALSIVFSFLLIFLHFIPFDSGRKKKQAKAKSIGNKASLNERYSLISQFERSDEDLLHCTRHNINYYLFVVYYVYLDWWMNECRMYLVTVCVSMFNICFVVFFSWIFSRKSDTNHRT